MHAPIALTISIKQTSEAKLLDKQLAWRHDGQSYLRPVHLHVGPGTLPHTFDFMCEAEPATIDLLARLFAFDPAVHVRREELPDCWIFAGHRILDDIKYGGARHTQFDPARLMTADSYGKLVREWRSINEPAAAVGATRAAERYVLVDSILHRRVPAPVWRMPSYNPLLHGEDASAMVRRSLSDNTRLWPVTLSTDFGICMASPPDLSRPLAAAVEYSIDPDEDGDLAAVGHLILQSI